MKKIILILWAMLIVPFSLFASETQDNSLINIITNKIQSTINTKGEEVREKFISLLNNFKEKAKNNLNERVQKILDWVLGNIQPKQKNNNTTQWEKTQQSTATTTTQTTSSNNTTSTPTVITTTTAATSTTFTELQNAILDAVNKERQKVWLSSLKLQNQLNTTAQLYAEEMAKNDHFSHEGKNGSTVISRTAIQGYKWKSIGENLAMGTEKVSLAMDMWMNSAWHKANILNKDFQELGVGYYNLYRVQVFGKQ